LIYKTKDAKEITIGNQNFSGDDEEKSLYFSLD
jgi:hypothetical protein